MEPGRATINSEIVAGKSENMEQNTFQSQFACELDLAGRGIVYHFKSEFAADLQSSLVIVNDKETEHDLADDQEKLFNDLNNYNLAEDHQSEQVKYLLNC